MLRFTTAGESHGRALVAIVEGLPAGLPVDVDLINHELRSMGLNPLPFNHNQFVYRFKEYSYIAFRAKRKVFSLLGLSSFASFF